MTPRDLAASADAEAPPDPRHDQDADAEALAAARAEHVKAMPDAYLICREGGHRMGLDAIVNVERIRVDNVDHLLVTRRCACCTSERVDVLTEQYEQDEPGWLAPRHELVRREYRYPDNYIHEGGRIPRGEVRTEWFRRHKV